MYIHLSGPFGRSGRAGETRPRVVDADTARSGIESITPRLVRESKVSQHHQKELTRGLLRIEGHVEAESEAEGKVGVLSALTLLP